MNLQRITVCILISLLPSFLHGENSEPEVSTVRERILGENAQFNSLTINITCNPQQIIKDINQKLFMFMAQIPQIPVKEYGNKFSSAMYEQRYNFAGCAFICTYSLLFYTVIKGNAYLGRSESWAKWKSDRTLPELFEISQSVLEKELLVEIQQRYTNPENPTDFISSLVTFVREIDREIAQIRFLIELHTWLTRLHIIYIFPLNSRRFKKAPELLNRLVYIRTIFLNWAAHYKIDQAKRYLISESAF